jgi:hypothetical protein
MESMESTATNGLTAYFDISSSAGDQESPKVPGLTDWLIRLTELKGNTGNYYQIAKIDTATIVNGISRLCANSQILSIALKNLWRNHKYNQEYISYLLGSYSKEDFKTIAKTFAEPLNDASCDHESIANALRVICSTLNQDVSSDEIALFLNVTPSCVENSIKKIISQTDQEETD